MKEKRDKRDNKKERKEKDNKKERREKKGGKKVVKKQAETEDKQQLYQQVCQAERHHNVVPFISNLFKQYRDKDPISLREDNCKTALLSTKWVKSNPARVAKAVDSDKSFVDWGRRFAVSELGADSSRVAIMQQSESDVNDSLKYDIISSLDFGVCYIKQRVKLIQHFQKVVQSLDKDGIFICDIFGGAEAVVQCSKKFQYPSFKYTCEQEWFNPLTHDLRCHFHFSFADRSTLKRGFSFDWRLWSIPELRECMIQAGFSKVKVWWKNSKQQTPVKQMKKLAIDDNEENESEDESENENEEEAENEESEKEEDDLSGDEMEDFIEVENAKQTKRWNAYVVGIL